MRHLDRKKRQDEILDLIVREYIENASTISSEYLKNKYDLPMSSATLRNIMAELEELGYVSHIHTSSGRIPTPEGFRYYVKMLMNPREVSSVEGVSTYLDKFIDRVYPDTAKPRSLTRRREHGRWSTSSHAEDTGNWGPQPAEVYSYKDRIYDLLDEISKVVSYLTHYVSLGVSSQEHKFFYSGMQFILDQPEFEDVRLLRNLFVALEGEASDFLEFVNENLKDGRDIKILIGDDIALDEIRNCSLTLSPVKLKRLKQDLVLGVLGPIRMDYDKVVFQLRAIREYLEEIL